MPNSFAFWILAFILFFEYHWQVEPSYRRRPTSTRVGKVRSRTSYWTSTSPTIRSHSIRQKGSVMDDKRIEWHEYFMRIAEQVATRSTCDRKNIGAVIVRDKTILSTGYNGSLRGASHCDEVGHDMENGHCVRTVHAEANAVAQAAKNGVGLDNSEIYVTASPCLACFKLVANCGIKVVYYKEFYRDERITKYAQEAGITLIYMGKGDLELI